MPQFHPSHASKVSLDDIQSLSQDGNVCLSPASSTATYFKQAWLTAAEGDRRGRVPAAQTKGKG
jgi:hypothetical protein